MPNNKLKALSIACLLSSSTLAYSEDFPLLRDFFGFSGYTDQNTSNLTSSKITNNDGSITTTGLGFYNGVSVATLSGTTTNTRSSGSGTVTFNGKSFGSSFYTRVTNPNGSYTGSFSGEILGIQITGKVNYPTSIENAIDSLDLKFEANGKVVEFSGLTEVQAKEFFIAHETELYQLATGAAVLATTGGTEPAVTETLFTLNELVLQPTKGLSSKSTSTSTTQSESSEENNSSNNESESDSEDEGSIEILNSQANGAISYSHYNNNGVMGRKTGLVLGYTRDLNAQFKLRLLLPYEYGIEDNIAKTESQTLSPTVALSYTVDDTDDYKFKVGANLQATLAYSKSSFTELGYVRYSSTLFAAYNNYVSDDLTITSGVTYGLGRYFVPGKYQQFEPLFDSLGTDKTVGIGALIEYDINDELGLDFNISATHNFNDAIVDQDMISISPQLRYSVLDTFTLNVAYKRTQKVNNYANYKSDTIMLNAIYNF